jgi:O-antigen biosynthesis protein
MRPMARRILIGVHVTSVTEDPAGTLLRLYQTITENFELRVLVDPAPGEADAVLETLRDVQRLTVSEPGGAPASFNLLVAEPADLYVLVESGVHPGPDWLTQILAALDADPANGLAGPSTNRCWNEQAVASARGATPPEVTRQAAALAQRFRGAWRSMAPLHSLSDFCLAVRGDVVAAVGAADTAYGRGPCWELDYNIRAARAGFRGVWAQAAFVYRGPMPAWRAASEPHLLEVNKRLYQDRFCGRRARPGGHELPYHAHCNGDFCADFASAATTRVHLPLPARVTAAPTKAAAPLISCIMPTRGRPKYVAQSVAYFRRQDYPNRELIIVYENEGDLPDGIDDLNIKTVRTTQPSIGAKRNEAVLSARGEIIAQWDDDDWYSNHRLSRQVQPILEGVADITALNDTLFMVSQTREFWSVTPDLFSRLFMENVVGGTLIYRRALWCRENRYPMTSLREDAQFLINALRAGARLCGLSGRELFIYVRHDRNTWKFCEGRHVQQSGWSLVPEPACLAADRAFYFGATVPAAAETRLLDSAMVSCIMPTANRRRFVPGAIAQFLAQDHARKELVVLDDGDDLVADLIPQHPSIRYFRTPRHRNLGAKRNAACDATRGDIILHWDDDDWYAPDRIRLQVEALCANGADLSGLDGALLVDPRTQAAWEYVYPPGGAPWVFGATMCYRREYWRAHPFADTNVGEDARFAAHAGSAQLYVLRDNRFFVALIHSGNTSPKHMRDPRWRPRDFAVIRALTGPDWPPPEQVRTTLQTHAGAAGASW